jgi:hypothetical protein
MGIVIIFIPRQLPLGHVVEHHQDHLRLLHNLPNSTTQTQKIVVSSVFPVTEILGIEDHKLYITFHHIAFRSQSLLKPTSNQTGYETN